MSALGFIEIPSLGVTAVVADLAVKSANVRLLGIETTGNEKLMIRLGGDVAAVQTALDTAVRQAEKMGVTAVVNCIANPDAALAGLIHFPNTQNPLYGGRDQLLPDDYPNQQNQTMSAKPEALGILETQGLTAILEATESRVSGFGPCISAEDQIFNSNTAFAAVSSRSH